MSQPCPPRWESRSGSTCCFPYPGPGSEWAARCSFRTPPGAPPPSPPRRRGRGRRRGSRASTSASAGPAHAEQYDEVEVDQQDRRVRIAARERAANHPVSRDPHRGRDQADLDRTEPAGRRRRHASHRRDGVGLVADRDPRAAVPGRHPGRRDRDADRALRDRHGTGHRRGDARRSSTASRRTPGCATSSKGSRASWSGPVCTRVSSVRRRSASSTSRATAG